MRNGRGCLRSAWVLLVIALCAADAFSFSGTPGPTINVYVMSGGNASGDQAVLDALIARGHTPTLGVEPRQWDGSQRNLQSFDVVVLLNNYNWATPDMPAGGQKALLEFVSRGGGLVTGEWLTWNIAEAGRGTVVAPMIPAFTMGYDYASTTTYVQAAEDPIINKALPRSFSFDLNDIQGTRSFLVAKAGATVFYPSGLIGWDYMAGRVISFSTLLSEVELANSNYARLFVNAVEWTSNAATLETDFSIADRGGVSLRSSGTPGAAVVGYAAIRTNSGATPSGLAILGLRQNNVLVSETSVPASSLIQSGRIYAEINGPINTALAIANPNDQPALISFYFTGAGGDFGSASLMVPAYGQVAGFLNQAPFNGPSLMNGTFTFNSSVPVSVFALRGSINERSEFMTTTLPVADPVSSTARETLVFPHFAEGGGWTTQIVLVNPTDTFLYGRIEFRNALGEITPVVLSDQPPTLIPTTVMRYSIPARSSQKLRTSGEAASTVTGSVRVVSDLDAPMPVGVAILSRRSEGVTFGQAGVPTVSAGSAFRLYAEALGDFAHGAVGSRETALAIANNSSTSATVSFDMSSLDGSSTGRTGTLAIPGDGQVAIFLKQIPGFESLPAEFQGILRVSSAASFSVIGVRGRYNERKELLFTVMPPADEGTVPSPAPLYFPHIVDSGGYTTQFILFAGQPGPASSGTIQVFSQGGVPLKFLQ
jgi:hypothetical protein